MLTRFSLQIFFTKFRQVWTRELDDLKGAQTLNKKKLLSQQSWRSFAFLKTHILSLTYKLTYNVCSYEVYIYIYSNTCKGLKARLKISKEQDNVRFAVLEGRSLTITSHFP